MEPISDFRAIYMLSSIINGDRKNILVAENGTKWQYKLRDAYDFEICNYIKNRSWIEDKYSTSNDVTYNLVIAGNPTLNKLSLEEHVELIINDDLVVSTHENRIVITPARFSEILRMYHRGEDLEMIRTSEDNELSQAVRKAYNLYLKNNTQAPPLPPTNKKTLLERAVERDFYDDDDCL
jgi:hypothetical protein